MNTANKLATRYSTAKALNAKLAAEVGINNGATGLTATFFVNASKDLTKVTRQIKNALANGDISVDEYKSIMA